MINCIKSPDQRRGYGKVKTLAEIFEAENYANRLLKLLQNNAKQISFIDQHAKTLRNEYPDEVLDLYEESIRDFAQQTGRKITGS
ncbi:hypothetical protein [Fodinibius sp.]|uniref:hypothetical protein n=1 Tax=Fodinibius sp. TaxID=1872440 RepID=UPI002ACEF38D|nr:hypothetical protein [Fodinibius sp.]MDZ7660443.1 hypothetical protein [Fodinibius sp.]